MNEMKAYWVLGYGCSTVVDATSRADALAQAGNGYLWVHECYTEGLPEPVLGVIGQRFKT